MNNKPSSLLTVMGCQLGNAIIPRLKQTTPIYPPTEIMKISRGTRFKLSSSRTFADSRLSIGTSERPSTVKGFQLVGCIIYSYILIIRVLISCACSVGPVPYRYQKGALLRHSTWHATYQCPLGLDRTNGAFPKVGLPHKVSLTIIVS